MAMLVGAFCTWTTRVTSGAAAKFEVAAESAASGMKNREIAEHLFVTLKTVEMHLSKTYGKLEVKGRDGLAEAFAAA